MSKRDEVYANTMEAAQRVAEAVAKTGSGRREFDRKTRLLLRVLSYHGTECTTAPRKAMREMFCEAIKKSTR